MRALEQCRLRLGGHLQCDHCGAYEARYHSCRNRHCPKCQPLAKARWVEARLADLLPIPYFHCVFTLPHTLNPLAQGNPRVLYALLFQAAWDTLHTFGRDPRWLGGDLGATMVLHTWGQTLDQHLHVHCLVTGGALVPEEDRWIPTRRRQFLFPVRALSRVFRGKYLDSLHAAFTQGQLQFAAGTASLEEPTTFGQWLDTSGGRSGSSMQSRPSQAPSKWWRTSGAIPIGLPSAMSVSSLWRTASSTSAGAIIGRTTPSR